MTPDEIVAQAEAQGLQLVRFLYCDNGGVDPRQEHARLARSRGGCRAASASSRACSRSPASTPSPPTRPMAPSARSASSPIPRHVRRPAVRAAQRPDARQHARARPLAVGARPAVRSCNGWCAKAADAGLAFDAAFENEFYLAYRTDAGYQPVDRSLCFSAIGMDSTEDVIQDIIAALTRPGPDRRAVAPGARLGPAGAVDPARPGAARRRQPDHLPPDGPRRRGPARPGRLARPEAVRRPGGQRRPPPLEHLGRGHTTNRLADASAADGLSPLARSAIAGVVAHLPGLLGLTTPERQLVPPAPAALLELRLHGVGDREPRGRGARPEPLLGRRGGLDEPRAQGQRRERQPVHLARRRHGGGARRHRARARSGRPGRRRPRQPDRRRAGRGAASAASRRPRARRSTSSSRTRC